MKDVIVIGGGVAGLQAAVFTAKAGEDTLVLDTDETLVYSTSNIQNLVGHDSIGGQELIRKARNKLSDFEG
ncbi:MAG: FAD-dependent oxidoreductase, partial [Candidatus Nanohaloarchaea archaeon]